MFMHIFGKSDQNMVVIVSNEKANYGVIRLTGNIVSGQRTAHRFVPATFRYKSIHAKKHGANSNTTDFNKEFRVAEYRPVVSGEAQALVVSK